MIDKVNQFRMFTENMAHTYERKNSDYGDSFSTSVEKYGTIAALVRISDKFNRLENLILSGEGPLVKDESLKDTLLDMASYCIMTAMEIENSNSNK